MNQFVADGENSWDVYRFLISGSNFLGAECDESGRMPSCAPQDEEDGVSGSLDFGWI